MTAVVTDFWASVLPTALAPDRLSRVHDIAIDADARRRMAEYDTGSIAEVEAALLWALADVIAAKVVIEVGTFIGTSTIALASASSVEAVYTCDASNDCLPATNVVHTYPKQGSTQMLRDVLKRHVLADLCFFDGVLRGEDVTLLGQVTHPDTVYAFHDYNYGPKIRRRSNGTFYMETMPRKGIGNVELLHERLTTHTLVHPLVDTTLALLVPESRM